MNFGTKFALKGFFCSKKIFGCWLEMLCFLIKTRKVTGFTSLWVNYQKINQVSPKCEIYFSDKTCKNGLTQKRWRSPSSFTNWRSNLGINFQLLNQINPKRVFRTFFLKNEKNYQILLIWISLVPNFSFEKQFWFFETIFPNKKIWKQKQQKWTSPINYSYQISQSIKFYFQQRVLNFGTKFSQRVISGQKQLK